MINTWLISREAGSQYSIFSIGLFVISVVRWHCCTVSRYFEIQLNGLTSDLGNPGLCLVGSGSAILVLLITLVIGLSGDIMRVGRIFKNFDIIIIIWPILNLKIRILALYLHRKTAEGPLVLLLVIPSPPWKRIRLDPVISLGSAF